MEKKFKNCTKYYTHFNGGRPFIVYIKKDVCIYSNSEYDDSDKNSIQYESIVPEEIFIGTSPKIKMTEFSKGYGKKFDGNSILLNIKNYKYLFVGEKIIEFTTKKDKIIDFISPVGNNDVPYPCALGEKYIYCFCYPHGYFLKKDLDIKHNNFADIDIDDLFDTLNMYAPFANSFANLFANSFNKSSNSKMSDINMTIKEFKKIMELSVDDIPVLILKNLCRIFKVTRSGTKSDMITRLEKVANLKFNK